MELRLIADLTDERRRTGTAFEVHVLEGRDESITQFAVDHDRV